LGIENWRGKMSGRYYKGRKNTNENAIHVIFASTRSSPNGKRHGPPPARSGQRPTAAADAALSTVCHTRTRTTAPRRLSTAITPFLWFIVFTVYAVRARVHHLSFTRFGRVPFRLATDAGLSVILILFVYDFPVYRFVCADPTPPPGKRR